jgi:hypothetical protein
MRVDSDGEPTRRGALKHWLWAVGLLVCGILERQVFQTEVGPPAAETGRLGDEAFVQRQDCGAYAFGWPSGAANRT